MHYCLVHRDDALGQAWRSTFGNRPDVEIVSGDITETACNAVVSPANSFGFMDGGLDLALSERFGWQLQARLKEEIHALPERELLIGKALVIATQEARTPWIIAAPTMRVPMSFNIASSVNAYLAMKAILLAAQAHEGISTVAVPGLCTGVGRMPPEVSAIQMFAAYEEVVCGNRPTISDFGDAQKHQLRLNANGMIWDF